ncbi:MAG: TolC family protein, partial [Cyclobacteriaceae bacterium]|nr:TolC family protein [Cyclobacteriaceae bacterium]
NYSKYERSLDIDMKLIQLNEQALEIMLSEYTSGLRKFEDLLLLESQLLSFKISAENARVNKQKAITMIQFLSGVY